MTVRGGANLEHRYTLNCVQRRPTGLIRTAVTGGFSVSAGRRTVRTSLGVKGSQVQILSSRRRDRAVSLSEMPPDLCPDLGELSAQLIISGSSFDLAGWLSSASARVSGANLECWGELTGLRRTHIHLDTGLGTGVGSGVCSGSW